MNEAADGLTEEARRVATELHLAAAALRARHQRMLQQRRTVVAARWAEVVARADRGPEELQTEIERAHERLPAPRMTGQEKTPAVLGAQPLSLRDGTDEETSTP